MQLTEGLLLGEACLIDLLLGVEHVKQRARAEIEILLVVKLAGTGAERLLAALNLQRALQAHHLAAGLQQFLADIKPRALNGRLRRFHRVSGGVTPGGEAAALIERHLHLHPGGILRAIPRFAARVAIVQIVTDLRLQRDGWRHLRVGVVEVGLGDVGLCPGGKDRRNQTIVRLGDVTAAGQLLRKIIADRVQAVPAEKAHQRGTGAVEAGLILHQLRARPFNTCVGLHHVRKRGRPFVVTLTGQCAY